MKKRTKIVLGIVGGITILAGIGIYKASNSVEAQTFIAVRKGTLVQEVSLTGKVESAEDVELGFERTGTIATVSVAEGQRVEAGEVLAELSAADLRSQVREAEAALAIARAQVGQYQGGVEAEEARLREIKKGARREEIDLAKTQLESAKKSLADAKSSLSIAQEKAKTDLANVYADVTDVVADAYAKADNSVRTQTTEMLRGDSSNGFTLTFQSCDVVNEEVVKTARSNLERTLVSWKKSNESIAPSSSIEVLDAALTGADTAVTAAKNFLDKLNTLLTLECSARAVPPASYKTSVATAITNINLAASSVNNAQQAIASQKRLNDGAIATATTQLNTAQNAVNAASDQLTLKKVTATAEQLAIQEAKVKQARASLDTQRAQIEQAQARLGTAEAQLSKAILRSPIAGIVTKMEAKVGQIAAATPLINIVSTATYQIVVQVPEVDVAKLKEGQKGSLTLDAYGSDVRFEATVVRINPAETLTDGVPTYKATFQFTKEDERIRSGMTANIDVETERRENALIIPQRAITTRSGEKLVRVLRENEKDENGLRKVTDVTITTGLRGTDGVEVISGLTEGDQVLIYTEAE